MPSHPLAIELPIATIDERRLSVHHNRPVCPIPLEGQVEIDFDGEVIVFNLGDGVFIPPGEEHKHKGRVLTDKVTAILVEEV